MPLQKTGQVDSHGEKTAKDKGTWESITDKIKEQKNAQMGYGSTASALGNIALQGTLALLGKVPLVGSVLKTGIEIVLPTGIVNQYVAKNTEANAMSKLRGGQSLTQDDLGTGYLSDVFKGFSTQETKELFNALIDLDKANKKLGAALEHFQGVKSPNCQTFANAYSMYHKYRITYNRAMAALGWLGAFVAQCEELLNPVGPRLKQFKEAIDQASDSFYSSTDLKYHGTHCKHVESGVFSGPKQVGFCVGGA